MSTEDEKLTAEDLAAAALIDRELPGMGRDIVAAAKAMFEAEHGPDAYANATAPRRAHYRFLATLALRPAIKRLISERDEAREAVRPPLKAFWGDEVLCDRHCGGPPMWGTIASVETHYSFGEDRAPYHIYAVRFGQNRRREWHSDDAIHTVRRAALSPKPAKREGE